MLQSTTHYSEKWQYPIKCIEINRRFVYISIQCHRSKIHIRGGGATFYIASNSVHYYKGNAVKFDNYWGAPAPQSPISNGLTISHILMMTKNNKSAFPCYHQLQFWTTPLFWLQLKLVLMLLFMIWISSSLKMPSRT